MKWTKQNGEVVEMAKAICEDCGETMESTRPGDYVGCSCEASAVDTDRWFPERHRYMGNAKPVPDTSGGE